MDQGLPRQDRLIWIQKVENIEVEGIWESLKSEFTDPLVVIDEDEIAIGLAPLPENASNEDIKAAGRRLADHIINILNNHRPAQ